MSDSRAASTEERTILFADIVSSTALYERLGNVAAKDRVGGCLDGLMKTAERFGGKVVKSLGDGILCSFVNAQHAVLAGFAMYEGALTYELDLRIGIHGGEVLEEDGDVFGDAVNTAARIADLAKPCEVLLSKTSKEALPPEVAALVRNVPPVALKGKQAPIALYAVSLEDLGGGGDGSQTMCTTQTIQIGRRPIGDHQLSLTYRGSVVSVPAEKELTIGRDSTSGLAVDHQEASRRHASVFLRQGKFVLADQSTNGTYLIPRGQKKVHLLREQAILSGSGVIYPGVDPDAVSCEPIEYSIS